MTASRSRFAPTPRVWFLLLLVATFLLYVSGLNIWYYGDDFQYLFTDPPSRILYFFGHPNLFHGFYRPINSSIIAIVQSVWGRETWPIHIVNIVVHAVLAWLVYRFMRRERFSTAQAVIGSAFMVISQENAGAVLSNDTFSQISGTFFGCLALWILYRAFFRVPETADAPSDDAPLPVSAPGPFPVGAYLLALVMFTLSLMSKETSASFLPITGLFFIAKNWTSDGRPTSWGTRIGRSIVEALPFLVLTLVWMWFRSSLGLSGPSTSGGNYGFSFGLNMVRNFGQFLFAAVLPASSADAFVAVTRREMVTVAVMAAGSLLFLGLVALGTWRGGARRSYLPLGLFALLGLIPAIFLNHVGELYLYNSMPFIAVFVGAGLGALWKRAHGAMRIALAVVIVVMAVSHGWAIQTKAAEMRRNGDRVRRMLPQVLAHLDRLPPGGVLVLRSPSMPRPEYSVFIMEGFSPFKWGTHIINQESHRPDVVIAVADSGSVRPDSLVRRAVLTLTLSKEDSVVVYERAQ